MYDKVELNKYGYYTLKKSYKVNNLNEIFENEYFQSTNENSEVEKTDKKEGYLTLPYKSSYCDEELNFFNFKLEEKLMMIEKHMDVKPNLKFLDIGCGEGFALKFFKAKGFEVLGLDYSTYGIEQHNADMKQFVMQGDASCNLKQLILDTENNIRQKFDIINIDHTLNLFENPDETLLLIKKLLNTNGILVITVGVDFSPLQEYVFSNKIVSKPYWVVIPTHISYFNKDGLINLCNNCGYKNLNIYANSLIELNLFNVNTNYIENPSVGKECYLSRIKFEKMLHNIYRDKLLEFYECLGNMNLGREIIAIFSK